ncbi:hypothetical protein [Archangium primigenium]|uniref:hypothetical protein n=1 Tax=[Archangium] primigenium TaxID=2792470 RepID=UPI00195E8510|nr:hypothetical protein [Archangium primigenium]MBM7116041.1 hypothetical protein [Archangium primigenium]
MAESKAWMLPGNDNTRSCLLVFVSGKAQWGGHKAASFSWVKSLLDMWLVSDEHTLQDIYRQSIQHVFRKFKTSPSPSLLKKVILQELQFGRLLAFEVPRNASHLASALPHAGIRPAVQASTSQMTGQELLEEWEERQVDVKRLSVAMKVRVALQLSVTSWPGQIGETALRSFSDPRFVLTLFGIMGLYVALWLVPDPTLVTKIMAGMLTTALLAQFAWEDIYGLVKAWFVLEKSCESAKTQDELRAAGETFAEKVGQVGFDILLFIVMGRVARRVQPTLREIGAKRAVVRAEARLETARSQPGSGFVPEARGEALEVLDIARAEAKSADPGSILDALSKSLPELARGGLLQLRGRVGDARALQTLESSLVKGRKSLDSFLAHEGASKAQVKAARGSVLASQAELARARMNWLKTLQDPLLRDAMGKELVQYVVKVLRTLKSPPDWAALRKAIQARDIDMLVGELGEALQRSLLAEKYPAAKGYRVFANIEVVRRVKGFFTKKEWQFAERNEGREGNPRGLYEADGALWKSITEVDALIAEPTLEGRWRPVELEQMKTGKNDQHSTAQMQNTHALKAMEQVVGGNETVQLFERVGKNELGKNMTASFDLSKIQDVAGATRGTAGKLFTENIPFTREVLEATAHSLVKNPTLLPSPDIVPPFNEGQRRRGKVTR